MNASLFLEVIGAEMVSGFSPPPASQAPPGKSSKEQRDGDPGLLARQINWRGSEAVTPERAATLFLRRPEEVSGFPPSADSGFRTEEDRGAGGGTVYNENGHQLLLKIRGGGIVLAVAERLRDLLPSRAEVVCCMGVLCLGHRPGVLGIVPR